MNKNDKGSFHFHITRQPILHNLEAFLVLLNMHFLRGDNDRQTKNKLPEENLPPAFASKLGPEIRDLSVNKAMQ